MGKVLVSLWLLGAALYTVNTIIIVDAVNLLGGSEDKTLAAAQTPLSDRAAKPEVSNPTPSKLAQQDSSKAVPPKVPAPDIQVAPDVAKANKSEAAETNTAVATKQTVVEPEITATEESEPAFEPPESDAAQAKGDRVAVTSAVNMRAGPTTSAPTLTVQQAGTELQVLGEEAGWIQVINPDTQQTGWIYSRYLNPVTSDQAGSPQAGAEDADQAEGTLTERTAQADADRDEVRERASGRAGRNTASDRSYAAKPSKRERDARAERRRYATADPEPEEEAFAYGPYRRYDPYRRLERDERYGWTAEQRRRGELFKFFFDGYPGPHR